jgi:hypothetical protein
MPSYRLNFWGINGRREGTFALQADSDQAACDLGSRMLFTSACTALEIWRDTQLLGRIGRDAPSGSDRGPAPPCSRAAA